jgi:hypothetical protein
MGKTIGSSGSTKVMFMDPRTIFSTIEGMRSMVGENSPGKEDQDLEQILNKVDRHRAS